MGVVSSKDPLNIAYSMADQNFSQTKSLGIFNVSRQLLEHLAQSKLARLTVFTNYDLEDRIRLPLEVIVQRHDEAIKSRLGRMIWDQWGVYEAAKNSGSQWLFLSKGFASFLKPPPLKLAVYIYDAVHDFYRVNYPGVMPWFEVEYFTRSLKKTLRYSDVIFTDSDFANGEIKRLAQIFKVKPPLIITAGIGFSQDQDNGLDVKKRNSLLLLTSVWPHKLTERAINFVERWQKATGFSGGVELVGSLPRGIHLPRLAGWEHYQRLPEIKYKQLLREAKVLLFFSAYEGFGMPPVEAMIVGTCPVFSDIPVTREVMGGSGFSFTNDSYNSFAQAMNKALNVTDAQMQLWAGQLLDRYNWAKVTEKIINGLTQVN